MTSLCLLIVGAALVTMPVVMAVKKYGWPPDEAISKFMFDMSYYQLTEHRRNTQLGCMVFMLGLFNLLAVWK